MLRLRPDPGRFVRGLSSRERVGAELADRLGPADLEFLAAGSRCGADFLGGVPDKCLGPPLELAGRLSQHESLTFGAVTTKRPGEGFMSIAAIVDFLNHINRRRHVSGLEAIPEGDVTPHRFRRTMAMLTRDFPGSEIAVGMQLKHVTTRALANRVTSSYMDNDPSWARQLDSAIADRRFDRLAELFDADTSGHHIGFGPGADRMREAFTAVRANAQRLRTTGQDQLDAAAIAITAVNTENAALRRQVANSSARIVRSSVTTEGDGRGSGR